MCCLWRSKQPQTVDLHVARFTAHYYLSWSVCLAALFCINWSITEIGRRLTSNQVIYEMNVAQPKRSRSWRGTNFSRHLIGIDYFSWHRDIKRNLQRNSWVYLYSIPSFGRIWILNKCCTSFLEKCASTSVGDCFQFLCFLKVWNKQILRSNRTTFQSYSCCFVSRKRLYRREGVGTRPKIKIVTNQ